MLNGLALPGWRDMKGDRWSWHFGLVTRANARSGFSGLWPPSETAEQGARDGLWVSSAFGSAVNVVRLMQEAHEPVRGGRWNEAKMCRVVPECWQQSTLHRTAHSKP